MGGRCGAVQQGGAKPRWQPGRRRRRPEGRGSGGPSAEDLLGYYREMLLIRRFEEKAGQLYGMGLIGGFCHLYIGQEAVAVGIQHALQPGDSVITGYRDHGHMLVCNMDPRRVMAELTGRSTGYSKGKGGSMHMFARVGRLLWRARHRRRPGAARHRPRLRPQIPRGRRHLRRLHGRRRRQPGPGLRELQHGGALEAADPLRDREQPLRHGHGPGRAPPPASACASAARPTASPAIRSTAWTWWRCMPRPTELVRAGPRRAGAGRSSRP